MGFIRKYILWVILLGSFAFAYFGHPPQPCDTPLTYKIGTFDNQFGVSQTDFLTAIKQAGDTWSKLIGKNLFQYDPNGKLVINLIYDSRQATTQKNQVIETGVTQNKTSADSLIAQINAMEVQYNADKKTYTDMMNSIQAEENKYNADVSFYNAQGGAPKTEYDRLVVEKQTLNDEGVVLETKRVALNNLGNELNILVQQHNTYIVAANAKISVLNQTAGKEFNEGEYITDETGQRINIYEFTSQTKLIRILEHELGHALGLEHNNDPQAIMYYLNQADNLVPTEADKASLIKICETNKTYLQSAFDMIQSAQTKLQPSL